jgi:hypothetical protein
MRVVQIMQPKGNTPHEPSRDKQFATVSTHEERTITILLTSGSGNIADTERLANAIVARAITPRLICW